jgi:glyoxylase-like metal-dependent hydrolase (beta-lactamase superfamily II)
MHIEKISNTPVTSNCYVINCSNSDDCIIIDPGSNCNNILNNYLIDNSLRPYKVILTHEHFDHIWGVLDLSTRYSFELISNENCKQAISNPKKNLSIFYDQVGFSITREVKTIEELSYNFNWNNNNLFLFNTPGHSEGSICIQLNEILFCGDILIQNEKTVTKFPGGSSQKLTETLSKIKSDFSPETLILSGHGENFLFKNYYNYFNI